MPWREKNEGEPVLCGAFSQILPHVGEILTQHQLKFICIAAG